MRNLTCFLLIFWCWSDCKAFVPGIRRACDRKPFASFADLENREKVQEGVEIAGESLKSIEEYNEALSIVLDNTDRTKREKVWAQVQQLWLQVQENELQPNLDTYRNMIKACGHTGYTGIVTTLVEQAKDQGIDIGVKFYTSAIDAHAQSKGRSDKVWSDIQKVWALMEEHGVEPDTATYNVMLKACGRHKRPEAQDVWAQMKDEGVQPDVLSFTNMIKACRATGKGAEVPRLLEEMKERGIALGLVASNHAISSLAESEGMLPEVEKVWNMLKESGVKPSTSSCNTVLKAYRYGGRTSEIPQLLDEMDKRGVPLDIVTYNSAIAGLGKSGDLWPETQNLWTRLKESTVEPNVVSFNSMIAACGEVGRTSEILQLLGEMKEKDLQPDVITYNSAIHALGKSKEMWPQVYKLWAQMKEESGVQPTLYTLGSMINACGEGGHTHYIPTVIKEMHKLGVPFSLGTYRHAIDAMGKSEANWLEVVRLWNRILQSKEEISVPTYKSMMRACRACGKYKMLKQLLKMMKEKGVKTEANVAAGPSPA